MKNKFVKGQLYLSATESELGPGIIIEVEHKTVKILFPKSETIRHYSQHSAPLTRVVFSEGDEVVVGEQKKVTIEAVEEKNGLYFYQADGKTFQESDIKESHQFQRPEEKLFQGHTESLNLFNLRIETLKKREALLSSSVRGLMGAKVSLLPHQLSIVSKVSEFSPPRALLADEVGLGKTIEAALILHQLYINQKIKRVLIITPNTLVHQWFVELLKRFNMVFHVIMDEENDLGEMDYGFDLEDEADGEEIDEAAEAERNIFNQHDLVITGLEFLVEHEKMLEHCLSASWDLLIVDEAHNLVWTEETPSLEYMIIQSFAKVVPGLLLLTATPEQLGVEGHFARLHLLDPLRFPTLKNFLQEHDAYGALVKITAPLLSNNEKLSPHLVSDLKNFFLQKYQGKISEELFLGIEEDTGKRKILFETILDLYGTGRFFYRNTRQSIKNEFKFFPKRIIKTYYLGENETDRQLILRYKTRWLIDFLKEHPEDKILLITHLKEDVLFLEKHLKDKSTVKFASFYEDQILMNRDRQAAFFADPQGAQILLSSEMGSEGRNFQFAHHLVLFDLPAHPDILEQRIGRLDRIGQKENIYLHVPLIKGTREEILYRWYEEGFHCLSETAKGASFLYDQVRPQLREILKNPQPYLENNEKLLQEFLQETKSLYQKINRQYEEGRDHLTEYNSFDRTRSMKVIEMIHQLEEKLKLPEFMEKVFNLLGVHIDDLDEFRFYIRPSDNMLIPSFPHLPADGLMISYDREKAEGRDDVVFLSWDHPMVSGVIDLLLGEGIGNVSVGKWSVKKDNNPVLFEFIFLAQGVAPSELMIERFFPPTPIRIVVDQRGKDVTDLWRFDQLNQKIVDIHQEEVAQIKQIPKEFVKEMLKNSSLMAQKKLNSLIHQNKEKMNNYYHHELKRMQELLQRNGPVKRMLKQGQDAYTMIDGEREELQLFMDKAQLQLDSIRLVLPLT